jgi:hypothetical protein
MSASVDVHNSQRPLLCPRQPRSSTIMRVVVRVMINGRMRTRQQRKRDASPSIDRDLRRVLVESGKKGKKLLGFIPSPLFYMWAGGTRTTGGSSSVCCKI